MPMVSLVAWRTIFWRTTRANSGDPIRVRHCKVSTRASVAIPTINGNPCHKLPFRLPPLTWSQAFGPNVICVPTTRILPKATTSLPFCIMALARAGNCTMRDKLGILKTNCANRSKCLRLMFAVAKARLLKTNCSNRSKCLCLTFAVAASRSM